VSPRGNWYVSQAGIHVHRVDAYDAWAGGFPNVFEGIAAADPAGPASRRVVRQGGWDPNCGLLFISGGTAAVSLQALHLAMERGRHLGLPNNVTEEIAA